MGTNIVNPQVSLIFLSNKYVISLLRKQICSIAEHGLSDKLDIYQKSPALCYPTYLAVEFKELQEHQRFYNARDSLIHSDYLA